MWIRLKCPERSRYWLHPALAVCLIFNSSLVSSALVDAIWNCEFRTIFEYIWTVLAWNVSACINTDQCMDTDQCINTDQILTFLNNSRSSEAITVWGASLGVDSYKCLAASYKAIKPARRFPPKNKEFLLWKQRVPLMKWEILISSSNQNLWFTRYEICFFE